MRPESQVLTCRRRSRWPTARSRTRRRAAPWTCRWLRSSRSPRTSARPRSALKLGKQRFARWVQQVRLRRARPGSGCRARPRASSCHPSATSGSTLGNMAIGQGLAVTPLQMAAGFSAIGNGGVLHRPHVILGRAASAGERVISQRTSAQVARDARGGARARRHRRGGEGAGLPPRGQDGHRREARPEDRRLLEVQVLLVLHRFRSRARPAPAWSP